MSIFKLTGVQYSMVFHATLTASDVGDTYEIDLPPGFILAEAVLAKRTAFNGTTPAVSIVDNKTSPTTIIASNDLASLVTPAVEAALPVKYTNYPNGGKLIIAVTGSGSTAGEADVIVKGIVKGRQNERYGTSAV